VPSQLPNHSSESLAERAAGVIELATAARVKVGVAESLTGGMIASAIVSVPGASRVFLGGVVAYANSAKLGLLDVDAGLLEREGAVSGEVATAMAEGIRGQLAIDGDPEALPIFAVSTTGVAGPDTQDGKPAGTVFVGLATSDGLASASYFFEGDRQSIRTQAAMAALGVLRDEIERYIGLVTV
jgi:nicotinamide-nucleotide amidase